MPQEYEYDSMGTHFKISIWDEIPKARFSEIVAIIEKKSQVFDALYSRFKEDSFVSKIKDTLGIVEVPKEFMEMLQFYFKLYIPSQKKINPCLGFAISDLGYDNEYSLITKEIPRRVPDLFEAVKIIDDKHIELHNKVLFDFGALGKGYFVDVIVDFLRQENLKRFMVDGSGDIYYEGNGELISVGLEHPGDESKVVGKIEMSQGAMASSATNRRRWGNYHHYIDPHTLTSPESILSVWVTASSTVEADAIASALFFVAPEDLLTAGFTFEYCILNHEYKIKYSDGFKMEIY